MAKARTSEFIDAMIRHQIYLEGYKTYQAAQFDKSAKEIEKNFIDGLSKLDVKTMDELSRSRILSFIATLRKVNLKVFDKYNSKVLDDLEKFVAVDWKLIADVMDDDKPLPIPKGFFKKAIAEPIVAVGQFAKNMLSRIGNAMIVKAERVLITAWGEGKTKDETLTDLIGEKMRVTVTPRNVGKPATPDLLTPEGVVKTNKGQGLQVVTTDEIIAIKPKADIPVAVVPELPRVGGVVNGARQDNQATVSTVLQDLSTKVKEGVIKKYSKFYVWVSVIDSRTTDICTQRDGTVYEMGEGPLPPAHIRCRSTIAPWDGTYYKSEFEDKDPEANIG